MPEDRYRPTKIFTVDEANRTLPLVRAIVADLTRLSRDVIDRRERLAHLMTGRESDSRDLYGEELADIKRELDKDTEKLQEYVDELRHLGVEPKDGMEGLVDFPSIVDGKLVFLCWKLGEPEVLYWHGLRDGFAGRQPLTVESMSADGTSGESSLDA